MSIRVAVSVALVTVSGVLLSACGEPAKTESTSAETTSSAATSAPSSSTAPDAPALPASVTATYTCDVTDKQLSGVFDNAAEPPTLVLTWGTDKATLVQQPSGSGIRYSGDGVEYEEHQGKVNVDFRGERLSCTPAE